MFILASASEPRSRLLKQIGLSHVVISSGIDESKYYDNDVFGLADKLSYAKAISVFKKVSRSSKLNKIQVNKITLLGCDSIFEFQGKCYGKPSNQDEAITRLKEFSSSSGYLHTGHCLLSNHFNFDQDQKLIVKKKVISTKINFNQFSLSEILNYVESKEPMRCAGGFSVEGKGSVLIKNIEGCYSNVIGLSLPWLKETLSGLDLHEEFFS